MSSLHRLGLEFQLTDNGVVLSPTYRAVLPDVADDLIRDQIRREYSEEIRAQSEQIRQLVDLLRVARERGDASAARCRRLETRNLWQRVRNRPL